MGGGDVGCDFSIEFGGGVYAGHEMVSGGVVWAVI